MERVRLPSFCKSVGEWRGLHYLLSVNLAGKVGGEGETTFFL